ncbi:hypothetical protein FF38_03735 [Lucilia cuprina]|uniref:Zinc finger PHD-type domain-containing protein n=1 Tax=Lucilia cuprina TaxID=7375 RepID=A0A0L0CAI1_LUCCU|nr:hypothetical protein FF38_03735 [Lucilia cuprina]
MPAAKIYKCGCCNDPIGKAQGSIMCSTCKLWLHLSCAKVSDKHLVLFKEKESSFSFTCAACLNNSHDDSSLRDEVRAIKTSLDDFIKKSQEDRDSYRNSLTEILSQFKNEVLASNKQLKEDILACNKLIYNIDSATTAKIKSLETENHVLYRRLYRGDIVLSGMPSGLDNLISTTISLCSFYDISISDRDINHVCYMGNNKLILVKFNCVSIRDRLMKAYFKTRSLKVSDVIGGEINSRVFLNDHHSPAASSLSAMCRKLKRQKSILKYTIINADKVLVKLTLIDGREVTYDADQCSGLFSSNLTS